MNILLRSNEQIKDSQITEQGCIVGLPHGAQHFKAPEEGS